MKRPDLRVPLAERKYPAVDLPRLTTSNTGFQLPAARPCAECPLVRTSLPGALGGYTVEQYIAVLLGPPDLACHMSPGFPRDISRQRSCTGVAMFRANVGLLPSGRSALDAVLATGFDRVTSFATPDEFRDHHTKKDTDHE